MTNRIYLKVQSMGNMGAYSDKKETIDYNLLQLKGLWSNILVSDTLDPDGNRAMIFGAGRYIGIYINEKSEDTFSMYFFHYMYDTELLNKEKVLPSSVIYELKKCMEEREKVRNWEDNVHLIIDPL